MIAQEGIRGGKSPRLSIAEVGRCSFPSKPTFWIVPWIRIRIKKEQNRGKLQISKEKLLPPH